MTDGAMLEIDRHAARGRRRTGQVPTTPISDRFGESLVYGVTDVPFDAAAR